MSRPPAATARVLAASALSLTALCTATACSGTGPAQARKAVPSPASPAAERPAPAAPTPGGPPALSQAEASAALITEADLGEPWTPTRGSATWRDGLLKATAQDPDCRRLLDVLYTEDLYGAPTGTRAVTGLDDAYTDAQLHYQVVARKAADVDRTLAWLGSLPDRCGAFTARTTSGGVRGVQVDDLSLPEVGDARQGLRVMLAGETADGEESVLTVEVAAVRVGEDAIGVTHGGLGDVYTEVTQAAADLGARRLTEVRRQARAAV